MLNLNYFFLRGIKNMKKVMFFLLIVIIIICGIYFYYNQCIEKSKNVLTKYMQKINEEDYTRNVSNVKSKQQIIYI